MKPLRYLVLAGNAVFILWIIYNAIDSGFQDIGSLQNILPIGLAVLLVLNIFLLGKQKSAR
jgi:hypothetical protein